MPDMNEGDNSTDLKGGNLVSPNDRCQVSALMGCMAWVTLGQGVFFFFFFFFYVKLFSYWLGLGFEGF